MPQSCAALGCRNGYGEDEASGISFHKFPTDPEKRAEWARRISRADFVVSERSVVCSDHFLPRDYETERKDTNPWRARAKGELQLPTLKPDAVPSIFDGPGVPKYLTNPSPAPRIPGATASMRLKAGNDRLQETNDAFDQADLITTTEEVIQKLRTEQVPTGFVTLEENNCVVLCYLSVDEKNVPQLLGSITVELDLTFSLWVDGKPAMPTMYRHIITSTRLRRFSELTNLMALVNNLTERQEKEAEIDEIRVETGKFVAIIERLWKICNTGTLFHGQKKRDEYREPVRDMEGPQIEFLIQFIEFLDQWQAMGQRKNSLTNETFLAVRQTCAALIALAEYCLDFLGFEYVLFRKFTQDFLERRFGWWRQLSGANYYITMKQILQNEKKVRAITWIHSGLTRDDLKLLAVEPATPELCRLAGKMATSIGQLLEQHGSEAESEDASTVQFVVGAIVRTETRQRQCQDCNVMLVENGNMEKPLEVAFEDESMQNANINSLIQAVSRGGLLVPSTIAFGICWKARNVFYCINHDAKLYPQFWSHEKPRALFTEIMMCLLEDDTDMQEILVDRLCCKSGHECTKSIVQRFFNCCAKNVAKDKTATGQDRAVSGPSGRIKRKLTSQ